MNFLSAKPESKWLPWFIVSLGAIFYCYEYLLRVSPSVMSQQLMQTYDLNAGSFGHLSAIYYYVYIPMQLLVGLLLDRYGPRRLLTMATFSCCVGAYLFAGSNVLFVAECGRFLMGFGSAFAFVGVLKCASIWLPPTRFGLISGLALALGMLGGVLGVVFLTLLVNFLGWRATCFWAAAFGILLAFALYAVIRDKNEHANFKVQPTQLHSVKLVWPELLRIFRNPQIWINGIVGCLLYMSLSTFAELWQIPYLKQGLGFTSEEAANGASMIFLGWGIGGPLMGWLSDKLRRRRILMTIGGFVAACLLLIVFYLPIIGHATILLIFFFSGLFCSTQVLIFPISREISPPVLTGTALAITNMITMLGGLLVPVVGMVLDRLWDGSIVNGIRIYSEHDYRVALSIIPVGFLLASALSLCLKETHCEQQEFS